MHLCDLPGSQEILKEQIHRLITSDLINHADDIFFCVNGDPNKLTDNIQLISPYGNLTVIQTASHSAQWEWPTLNFLKEYCDNSSEDFNLLYFHLKGVNGNPYARDWRRFMEYWNIDHWRDCVARLEEGYETVGVNHAIGTDYWEHYSGNFWWAKSSYIKKLDRLIDPEKYPLGTKSKYMGWVLPSEYLRFEHEAWLMSEHPRWFEIANSPGKHNTYWHYRFRYPPSEYMIKHPELNCVISG